MGEPFAEKAELERLLYMISNRLNGAELREGTIYDHRGKYDKFLTETFASIGYYIIELAHRHRDEFARKVVDSIPHLRRILEEMTERDESMDDWLNRVHRESRKLLTSPKGSLSDKGIKSEETEDSRCSDEIAFDLCTAFNQSQNEDDTPWIWKGGKKVKVGASGNGEVPSVSEAKRLLEELAEEARGLTMKDSFFTRQRWRV